MTLRRICHSFSQMVLNRNIRVIGRVARRIWATVMRDKYGANERSQKLKYHIQTSGRSLACTGNRL